MSTSALEKNVPASPFMVAFYAGLAGPASLYAPTPNYFSLTQIPPPAVSFAVAGAYLTAATKSLLEDKQDGDRPSV